MANGPRRRASSPMRRTALSGIPEASPPPPPARTITPGPNAFALRAAEVDAHRLQSNAFYQQATAAETARLQTLQDQEMAARLELAPPTTAHPALRENFHLGDSFLRTNLMANQAAFTQAKSSTLKPGQSPPLQLLPEEGFQANPTDRSVIEGFHEELEPNNSGNKTGRTRVFKYTPKLRSSEFGESVGPATPQKKRGGVLNWAAGDEQPGSPKKSIFEKLKRTAARTLQAPTPTSSYSIERGDSGGEALPPKVKAVLSTTPQNTSSLGLSPSKKLGMLARKATGAVFSSEMAKARCALGSEQQATSAGARKVNFSASVGSKTPARELRPKVRRVASQPQRQLRHEQDEDKLANHTLVSGVLHDNSLQYIDRQIPPTPPAKDTPPHEKKLKADQEEADRILAAHKERCENQAVIPNKMTHRKPVVAATRQREMQQKAESKLASPLHHKVFGDDTPTRETFKLVGEDGRTSPTKSGTYARKNLPTIVKAPSFRSMQAENHDDLQDEHSHGEVKKCVDGLGIDGVRDIPENFYKGDPNVTYSPSIYNDDWSTNVNVSNQTSADTLHSTGMSKPSPSIPNTVEHVGQPSSLAPPTSAAQYHQLINDSPTPSRVSPAITGRASSRSSSKGTISLAYPGLASDPSRMNLLADLDTRRGSASDTRRPHCTRTTPADASFDAMMDMSDESDEDPPQPSPNHAYSHPSAEPSPLYLPSSEEFSPVVPSTPKRKGNNESLSASPSPQKTLTPSRNRGRIEDYKNSPLARDVESFPVESQALQLPPPQLKPLTPTIVATPHAASPETFLGAPEETPLVVSPAGKAFVPIESLLTSTSAVQSDPQNVDNIKPGPVHDTSSLAQHRQAGNDYDGLFAQPINREEFESLRYLTDALSVQNNALKAELALHKKMKAEKEEGELAQVLAEMGGLKQRIEGLMKEKKGGN